MPRHKKGSNVSTCHASRVLLPSWSEQVSFLVTPTWGPGRTLDIVLRHFLSRLCWTRPCVLALLPSCPSDHSSLLHYWLLYQLHHFLDWVKVYGLLIGRWSQTSAFLHTRDPLTGNDPTRADGPVPNPAGTMWGSTENPLILCPIIYAHKKRRGLVCN